MFSPNRKTQSLILKNAFKKYWPLAILFFVLIVAFFPIFFMNKTLLSSSVTAGVMGLRAPWESSSPDFNGLAAVHYLDPGASAWQDEALAEKTSSLYKQGDFPLWNSSAALGKPLAAEMVSAVFYPLKAIVFAFPNSVGWDAFLLLRILVAMVLTYLFLRLIEVEKFGSVLGAVVFGLNGYFMLFIPMVHLNVEILLPLVMIGFEMIIREKKYGWLVLGVSVFGLITGGHPEASLLLFTFALLYFLYRLFFIHHPWHKIAVAIGGACFGTMVSLFLLIPFFELFQYAYTIHTPADGNALGYDAPAFFYNILYPYLLGQPLQTTTTFILSTHGTRYWLGVIPLFFIFVSVFSLRAYKKYTPIFLLLFVLAVTKQYGFLDYTWIQSIPLYNLVLFQKYLPPVIAFFGSLLVAFGYQYLRKNIRSIFVFIPLIFFSFTPIFLLRERPVEVVDQLLHQVFIQFFWLWILILFGVFLLIILEYKKRFVPYVVIFLGVIMIVEMLSLVPKHWSERVDPFAPPPYIGYLQQHAGVNRIFATDYLLYPNAASAFDLFDIRDLDAVFVNHYIRYIKEFINPSIVDRYTGMAENDVKENLPTQYENNPFFDLLNVKYVLAKKPFSDTHEFIDELISNNNGVVGPQVYFSAFTIDGETKPVLFQHPSAEGENVLKKNITPQSRDTSLSFAVAMDSDVWSPEKGDGVVFSIHVQGDDQPLYTKVIDPKRNVEDRQWHEATVSLGQYVGQEITVEFITTMGETNLYDYAGWGDLRLSDFPENEQMQYTTAYNGEVSINENTHAYPRAFLVNRVIAANSDDEVVAEMKKDTFNPRTDAVVQIGEGTAELTELSIGDVIPFDRTRITSYSDSVVTIETDAPTKSLLVLSDTFFPGWKVYVDGTKTKILKTDLALRGVVVDEGSHVVEFKYRPYSFIVGFLLSIFSLIVGIAFVVYYNRQMQSKD